MSAAPSCSGLWLWSIQNRIPVAIAYFGNLRQWLNSANITWRLKEVDVMDTFNRLPNREDYLSAPPSRAPKVRAVKPVNRAQIRWEERLGSLIAAAGIIWAVYVVTHNFAGDWNLQSLMPGPLPVCAIGILIWLHAKWRRASTRE